MPFGKGKNVRMLAFLLIITGWISGSQSQLLQFNPEAALDPVYAFPPNLIVERISAMAELKGENGESGRVFFDQEFYEGAPVHVYGTIDGLPYSRDQLPNQLPLPKAPPIRVFDHLVRYPGKPIPMRVLKYSGPADAVVDRATVVASLKEWKPAWGISCTQKAQDYATHLENRFRHYYRRKRQVSIPDQVPLDPTDLLDQDDLIQSHRRNSFSFFGQQAPLPWHPRHFPPNERPRFGETNNDTLSYILAALVNIPLERTAEDGVPTKLHVARDLSAEELEKQDRLFSEHPKARINEEENPNEWKPTWAEGTPVQDLARSPPQPISHPPKSRLSPTRARPVSRPRRILQSEAEQRENRRQKALIREAVREEVHKLVKDSKGPCQDALYHLASNDSFIGKESYVYRGSETSKISVDSDFPFPGKFPLDLEERPIPPGPPLHGLHIHSYGNTSGPGCLAAGPHFNPDLQRHGSPNDFSRHVGDLGNIIADQPFYIADDRISLFGRNNILGRSVVVHALPDDLGREEDRGSRTSGNAGRRVACGVIGRRDLVFFHD